MKQEYEKNENAGSLLEHPRLISLSKQFHPLPPLSPSKLNRPQLLFLFSRTPLLFPYPHLHLYPHKPSLCFQLSPFPSHPPFPFLSLKYPLPFLQHLLTGQTTLFHYQLYPLYPQKCPVIYPASVPHPKILSHLFIVVITILNVHKSFLHVIIPIHIQLIHLLIIPHHSLTTCLVGIMIRSFSSLAVF